MDRDNVIKEFESAVIKYQKEQAFSICQHYLSENSPFEFINDILAVTLENVGRLWEVGEISLSQVYLSSKICEEIVDDLFSTVVNPSDHPFRIAIVTLEDHHVLGKRIVSSMVRSRGFNLIDYGHGIEANKVIELVEGNGIDILLISVLMYPSALKVKLITDAFKERNIKTKVIVGGAPFLFDRSLWERVGADRMGSNGAEGIQIITEMVGEAQ